MSPHECAQYLGQPGKDEILRGAEADPAAQLRPREVALSSLVDLENALGELDHGVTVRCRHDRVGVADEQSPTNLFLELADVLADRRLLQAELDGRLREAAGLNDGQEGTKKGRIEHVGNHII